MKKKTTAAVLVAAMLVVTQRLPIRTSHAHAEGEEGHAGEASTPEQPTPQEETVSSEPVHVDPPKAEEQPEVKEESKPEEKPEVKEESKPEEKPEVKEEPKTEEKSEVKEEPKTEEKSEVKEEPKPEEKPEVKEEPKTEEKSEVKEETKTEEKSEVKDETKTEEKSEVKEEPKAEEKSEVKEETKTEEKSEVKEESETEEKSEVKEETKTEEKPEATEAPAETPVPTAAPEATEEPEQERQLPAILEQIEREGYAYVKTAGSGVKLYDSERMNRRIGNIDNGQSVLLALDYEEVEENQFAVYVVFGCDGRVMDGYVKLGDLDRQALDGDAFMRDHTGSSVRSDDYPLVNIGYTPRESQTNNAEKAEKPTAEPKKEEKPEATAKPETTEQPEKTEEPEATLAPAETLIPEATAEATATPEITPEPTEEPLNLPPIPTRIERNGYAYVRTAELEVKLYTDANLDNQFASIYEKGAVLLTDEYVERPEAKSYALHVYLADENGVVDGYVSLKRILKNPLDADLESGAESVDGLPVAKTKVHWKKNTTPAAKPTATPKPTETPAPIVTVEPTETQKPTGVDIATFEGKTSQNTTNNGISTLPQGTNRPVVVTDGQPAKDNGISVLPMGTDRPVVVADDQLPTGDMEPTPVIVWPDPDAPASDDGNADGDGNPDNGIALPILIDEERPVAGIDLPTEGLEPTEIITWPDPGEATPDEAEPVEDEDGGQTQEISVHVLIDWPEGKSIPEGAPVWMTAVVTGANAEEIGYQWQYSSDNENWIDIEGANRQSYEAVMTANNAGGYWRVSVSVPDQKQGDEEA